MDWDWPTSLQFNTESIKMAEIKSCAATSATSFIPKIPDLNLSSKWHISHSRVFQNLLSEIYQINQLTAPEESRNVVNVVHVDTKISTFYLYFQNLSAFKMFEFKSAEHTHNSYKTHGMQEMVNTLVTP